MAVAVLGVGGGVAYFLIAPSPTQSSDTSSSRGPHTQQEAEPPTPVGARNTVREENRDRAELEIHDNFASSGLSVDVESSRLKRYDDTFYNVNYGIENQNEDVEITRLQVRFDILDDRGQVVDTGQTSLIGSLTPELRPGEVRYFRYVKKTVSEAASARIRIDSIRTEEAKESYPPLRPITYREKRAGVLPDGVELTVRQREAKLKTYDDKAYATIVLVFEARRALEHLKVDILYRDAEGGVLERQERFVTYSSKTPVRPEHPTLFSATVKLPPDRFDHYDVVITEARLAK
jgi:hypothetical protein